MLLVSIVCAVDHMGKWWRKRMLKAAHVNFRASIITIIVSSCFSCLCVKIWCISKVWWAPKRLELLSSTPLGTYASFFFPNFPTCFKSRYNYACILTCNWIYKICYQLNRHEALQTNSTGMASLVWMSKVPVILALSAYTQRRSHKY